LKERNFEATEFPGRIIGYHTQGIIAGFVAITPEEYASPHVQTNQH